MYQFAGSTQAALDYNSTIIGALELSEKKWVLAVQLPGVSRHSRHVLEACGDGLASLVERLKARCAAAGRRYERDVQPQPKIGPWRDRLDSLLLENGGKPARERLTLIRVFEELRALGYEGGYDAVRRYARTWSKQHAGETAIADSFAFFRGACTRGIYDNMKTAVETILGLRGRASQAHSLSRPLRRIP